MQNFYEFAKLNAFRDMSYYVPTCLKLLHANVPSFFTCLRAYVPTYIFRPYVSLCLKLFRAHVHSFLCVCVPKTTHKI